MHEVNNTRTCLVCLFCFGVVIFFTKDFLVSTGRPYKLPGQWQICLDCTHFPVIGKTGEFKPGPSHTETGK